MNGPVGNAGGAPLAIRFNSLQGGGNTQTRTVYCWGNARGGDSCFSLTDDGANLVPLETALNETGINTNHPVRAVISPQLGFQVRALEGEVAFLQAILPYAAGMPARQPA